MSAHFAPVRRHAAMRRPNALPGVSVVTPTYREAANLPRLIERLAAVRDERRLDLELLLMDDDSRDGSEAIVAALNLPWVRMIVRTANRGLSAAVLDGLRAARHEVAIVMDADLSHPPEKIPEMLAALEGGAEFVIGSRYVQGGLTGEDWGWFRRLNSKAATWLARPFTRAADPMSGFFAFRRAALANAAPLNPIGYKIGLELIVKCRFAKVVETPIFFAQRELGESKLTIAEQLRYLQHVRRLFVFKHPLWAHAIQFAAVGLIGVAVNLAALTILLAIGLAAPAAVVAAISVAMLGNFALNRRFTFSHARHGSWMRQFAGFAGACSAGAAVNYFTTMAMHAGLPGLSLYIASLAGIAAGTAVNFVFSRWLVFRAPR